MVSINDVKRIFFEMELENSQDINLLQDKIINNMNSIIYYNECNRHLENLSVKYDLELKNLQEPLDLLKYNNKINSVAEEARKKLLPELKNLIDMTTIYENDTIKLLWLVENKMHQVSEKVPGIIKELKSEETYKYLLPYIQSIHESPLWEIPSILKRDLKYEN